MLGAALVINALIKAGSLSEKEDRITEPAVRGVGGESWGKVRIKVESRAGEAGRLERALLL